MSLTNLITDWIRKYLIKQNGCSVDNQRVTIFVLLDPSAAFDTFDDEVLLHRLCRRFGVCGILRSPVRSRRWIFEWPSFPLKFAQLSGLSKMSTSLHARLWSGCQGHAVSRSGISQATDVTFSTNSPSDRTVPSRSNVNYVWLSKRPDLCWRCTTAVGHNFFRVFCTFSLWFLSVPCVCSGVTLEHRWNGMLPVALLSAAGHLRRLHQWWKMTLNRVWKNWVRLR